MLDIYTKLTGFMRGRIMDLFQKYSLPRWMIFLGDNIMVGLVFLFAYMLRFNFVSADFSLLTATWHSIITIVVYAFFALIFRSYSGLIRHTTLTDIFIVFATTSSSALTLLILSFLARELDLISVLTIPISIILIHYVSISLFLFFERIAIKLLFVFSTSSKEVRKRVLIFGAGEMGFIVKRVLLSDPRTGFDVTGFLDDNKSLQGKKLNGIPVYNPDVLTSELISGQKIQTLIIAVRNISAKRKSDIINHTIQLGLEILETPALEKWLNGNLEVTQLQAVKLEDLLGREPIKLNLELIKEGLNNKTILVTGAAGSIGSEIVRQLSKFSTKKIILVDQAETPMFHLENELNKNFSNLNYKTILCDVTNPEKMELIFREFHPEIIFHAAAYKHVPLMEENPHEAFRVNIGGTKIMADLSEKYRVQKFVMISTDKSVNPTSVMGVSKRICEVLVQSKALKEGTHTQFVITRFGNVLGSNGSVIPLFRQQISEGGPLTVTHPGITRYFMTISEACELVLEAGFMGKGGEIFVFDMGEPVKIVDLAEKMIRLSGLEPGKDIKIEFIGLRPGEKLYEEPLSKKEVLLPTHNNKIKIANPIEQDCTKAIIKIKSALFRLYKLSESDIIELFEGIVPEYKNSSTNLSDPMKKENLIYKNQIKIDEP